MRTLLVLLAFSVMSGCITAKDQERAVARTALGKAYFTEGSTELAIGTLREATELDRKNTDAWNQLALAYMKRGAHDESEKAFKKALRIDPESAAVLLNYAYLLQNLGRTEEAIEHLELARQDLTYAEPARVLNNLGWAYHTMGRSQEAIQVLDEAVRRQPNFCGARYNLGVAYRGAGETARSITTMEEVSMVCKEEHADTLYPKALLAQGEMKLELGRREEGAMDLSLVADSYSGTPAGTRAAEILVAEGLR